MKTSLLQSSFGGSSFKSGIPDEDAGCSTGGFIPLQNSDGLLKSVFSTNKIYIKLILMFELVDS